jgi:exo-1,4-beta-D-glucosaminidase
MKVVAKVYNLEGKELATREEKVNVPADSSVKAFDLPKAEGLTMTFFAKLQMFNPTGKLVSDNFYWLSAKEDTLDWGRRQDTVYTPQAEFGDLTGLESLPPTVIALSKIYERHKGSGRIVLTLKNSGKSVAFMAHLRLVNSQGRDVVPVFWDDNYITLLPGESRQVSVHYETAGLGSKPPEVALDGWNVSSAAKAAPPSDALPKKQPLH